MRLPKDIALFLKNKILDVLPDATVYLFGSRANDLKKGGDIDILILASRELSSKEKFEIYWNFILKFGDQKIDLVSFHRKSNQPFKDVALQTAVEL